ncbi:hypothetical protein B5M09_013185 [Aphanomyces astaci]|uniref:DDE-1 domain-containing protein n=1 Tax=Aphanomyces astaci TaxID=112090 RepID=A0A425DNQ6_APHAT|nr:hypothetical protein B5M09_013185 [Aphanomyces astaci]
MKRFNLDGAGRPEEILDTTALTAFMLKLREAERAVTCTHLVNYLNRQWLDTYLGEKHSGYQTLLRLLQTFCGRHGFTRQRPTKAKRLQGDLDELRKAFALDFHTAFAGFEANTIFNVDETGMSYDMPPKPKAIWAVRGGSSNISSGEKHSYRMTTVLSVRADGAKLPILFIMSGMPGGLIEKNEFDDFPIGHHYAVQECAWMDARVWVYYLRSLLKPQVHAPSVLLLDSFDSHVSDHGVRIATEEVGCLVAPIPPNATSAVQPLDVGIMAPFKRHLRDLWLEEELIQGDDEEEDVDMMTVTAQRKRLAMVQRGIKAWARITPQEIRRSFFTY